MKKLLSTIACGAVLATTASADFARVEAGVGAWMNTPSGTLSYTETTNTPLGATTQTGIYTSNAESQTSGYAWMLIKHPVPVLPNIRLEYTGISDKGVVEGKFNDFVIPTGQTTTATFDMKQFDIVPYYNILDNTAWITLDLGLDLKVQQTDYTVSSIVGFEGYSDSSTAVIPLIYVRGRVQIPATNIGFESDVKAITDGTSTVYDVRAKVDYTLGFIPIVQPAIELGYRVQKFDATSDDEKTKTNLDFSGVYAGLMVRF